MAEVPGLHVRITGDDSDLKRKLKSTQKELDKTADRVKELRQQLKEMDDSGLDWSGEKPYEEMIKNLEEAEDKQIALTKEVERYKDALHDAGEAAKAQNQNTKLFGYNIGTITKRMFGFYAILRTVKEGISDFVGENPNSGLARFLNDAKGVAQDLFRVGLLPITATLDQIYGKASNVKVELKEINVELKDLSKYENLINKEVKQTKQLIGGFDELNILSANKEDTGHQEELNELTEYYVDLEKQKKEIEDQINQVYQEYADELGITVDQYKTLYTLWSNGHTEKAAEMAEKLGLNWKDVENNLTNFANNGIPKIEELQGKLKDLGDEMERVLDLINKLGGAAPVVKHDRLDHSNDDNTDTPGAWAKHVGGRTWKSAQELAQEEYELKGLAAQGIYTTPGIYHNGSSMYLGNPNLINAYDRYLHPNANGGVYTSPTVGLVGEYSGASTNPEIITPQSLMLETMEEANGRLADVVAQAASQVVSAIASQNLEVSIGDDVIASSAARGNRAYYSMTGSYMI